MTTSNMIPLFLSAFLIGEISHGHRLSNISFIEDERQSCPPIDCTEPGKINCSSDLTCLPKKCCIDLKNGKACCYGIGDSTLPQSTSTSTATTPKTPTTPKTATTPTSTATTAQDFTYCEGRTAAAACVMTPNLCVCGPTSPCYPDEICCLDFVTVAAGGGQTGRFQCYLKELPTTLPPATTPLTDGAMCPPSIPNPKCSGTPPSTCAVHADCQVGYEVCCQTTRDGSPCCVKTS